MNDELNFSVLTEEKEHMERLFLIADACWGENWLEAH